MAPAGSVETGLNCGCSSIQPTMQVEQPRKYRANIDMVKRTPYPPNEDLRVHEAPGDQAPSERQRAGEKISTAGRTDELPQRLTIVSTDEACPPTAHSQLWAVARGVWLPSLVARSSASLRHWCAYRKSSMAQPTAPMIYLRHQMQWRKAYLRHQCAIEIRPMAQMEIRIEWAFLARRAVDNPRPGTSIDLRH
jgi:hypothetical protein